ncbi:hypothetical protein GCM10010912_63970 [Paenibacillus albidus]|uniref:SMI1/KNR4 family protein n=1 Tax=Paenibacillus albidus TaxID=2041023 RepID=A0A917D6I8_9BACL|nr:hypothetical protein [Paenibacillus albidus]GGG10776.1 hypothetical protein GCM10010912_63970 [Paenibacillus albidus]
MEITLEQALTRFTQLHWQYGQPGEFKPLSADFEWNDPVHLSKELLYFYGQAAPVQGTGFDLAGRPLDLLAPEQLFVQSFGYRWPAPAPDFDPYDTPLVEQPDYWKEGWQLIALHNGEPVIASTHEAGTPVYAGYESGLPLPVADSFAGFLTALGAALQVEYGEWSGKEAYDEETFEWSAVFLQEVADAVTPYAGEQNLASFMKFFYG